MRFKLMRRVDANDPNWYEWCTYGAAEVPTLCKAIEEFACMGYKFGQTLKVEVLYG